MMKIFKCGIVMLLAITLVVGLCSCEFTKNNEIKKLTETFEKACNKLDLNGMLDCVDPKISKSVKAVTGFVGLFTDKDTEELLDDLTKVVFNNLPENSQEFFSSIDLKLDNIVVEEGEASATAEITYNISGEEKKTNGKLQYVLIDEKWYISNLDIE